jgi:tetratricopeptide (TPR) repeat protein
MVRNGLFEFPCAVLVFALAHPTVHGEDAESSLRTQLALQTALQQGRDNLQRGEYQAAVYCLEKEIARVDGNRDYMNALREAYRGYIRELQQSNRYTEARTYQERLKILDPGYLIEQKTETPSAAPKTALLAAQATPSAPPPRSTPSYTARPQMPDETDPFADGNKAQAAAHDTVLDRARREFEGKHYADANRLFEEANRLDSGSVTPLRDLWAYSKLSVATEALNKSGWPPPADAEKETLAALALSTTPSLQNHGKELLRAIHDRRIEIRHVPALGRNWAEVETANFRVIYHQSRELAEHAARVAETTRALASRRWFDDDSPPWQNKCLIFLYPTADYYAQQTGKPKDSPGHSTLKMDPSNLERVLDRRIDLHCDQTDMLTHILPHETTHAVLAGRFGSRKKLPYWADEGMAVLSEPREKIERYLNKVPSLRARRELFSLAELMGMEDYPESRRVTTFYVQSVSLVEFLCAQKGGPPAFARFVRDGLERGWQEALRQHYGFRDFQDLEARWSRGGGEADGRRAALDHSITP